MTIKKQLHQVKGAGLVEVMVAMVLGLVLSAGIIQIMNSSKQTYKTQSALTELQENARFALLTMEEHIKMAGFKADATKRESATYHPIAIDTPITLNFESGNSITSKDNISGNSDILEGTDVIGVRYQGAVNGTSRDCVGNLIDPENYSLDIYYVTPNNQLYCQPYTLALNSTSTSAGTPQPLVVGIENLQLTVNELTISGSSTNTSVTLGMLIHTAEKDGKSLTYDDDTNVYTLAGQDITANDTDEHRLRRVYNTTVAARN